MSCIRINSLFNTSSTYPPVSDLQPSTSSFTWLHEVISFVLYPLPPTNFKVYSTLLQRRHENYSSLSQTTNNSRAQLRTPPP